MSKKVSKKVSKKNEVQEEVLNPLDESRELEESQADAGVLGGEEIEADEEATHIILTRANLTFVVPGLWIYTHDGALSDCKAKTAFHGQMAKEFNMRVGDVVVCKNASEAVLVVIQKQ